MKQVTLKQVTLKQVTLKQVTLKQVCPACWMSSLLDVQLAGCSACWMLDVMFIMGGHLGHLGHLFSHVNIFVVDQWISSLQDVNETSYIETSYIETSYIELH